MSYRVDIPTLSANEVYTLTFEYEGTETIQLIVGDLTLETTDRRVVFTTTSPVNYIESNVNLTNLNMYEGYYEGDDFGGEYTQESIIEGKSLVNLIQSEKHLDFQNRDCGVETFEDNMIKLTITDVSSLTSTWQHGWVKTSANLKVGATYTCVIHVVENSISTEGITVGASYGTLVHGSASNSLGSGETGVVVFTYTTATATLKNFNGYYDGFCRVEKVGAWQNGSLKYGIMIFEGDYYDYFINNNIPYFEGIGCVKSPKILSETKEPNLAETELFQMSTSSSAGSSYDKETQTISITNIARATSVGFYFQPQKWGYGDYENFCVEFDVIYIEKLKDGEPPYFSLAQHATPRGDTKANTPLYEGKHYTLYFGSSALLDTRSTLLRLAVNGGTGGINKTVTITNFKLYHVNDINGDYGASEVSTYDCCKLTTPDDLKMYELPTNWGNSHDGDRLDLTTGILTKKIENLIIDNATWSPETHLGKVVPNSAGTHYECRISYAFLRDTKYNGASGNPQKGIFFKNGCSLPVRVEVQYISMDIPISMLSEATIDNYLAFLDGGEIIYFLGTHRTEQLDLKPLKSYCNGSIQTSSQQLAPTLKTTLPVSNKFTTTNLTSGSTYNVYFDGTATKLDAGGTIITDPVSPCEVECGGTTLTIEGTDIQNVRVIETSVKNEVGSVCGTTDVELSRITSKCGIHNMFDDYIQGSHNTQWAKDYQCTSTRDDTTVKIVGKGSLNYAGYSLVESLPFGTYKLHYKVKVSTIGDKYKVALSSNPNGQPQDAYVPVTDVTSTALVEEQTFVFYKKHITNMLFYTYTNGQEIEYYDISLIKLSDEDITGTDTSSINYSQTISKLEQPIKLRSLGTTYDSYNPVTGELTKRIGVSETDGSYSVLSSPLVIKTTTDKFFDDFGNEWLSHNSPITNIGYYVNENSGELMVSELSFYTDYLPIPKQTHYIKIVGENRYKRAVFYNASKQFVKGFSSTMKTNADWNFDTTQIPTNAVYVRFSGSLSTDSNTNYTPEPVMFIVDNKGNVIKMAKPDAVTIPHLYTNGQVKVYSDSEVYPTTILNGQSTNNYEVNELNRYNNYTIRYDGTCESINLANKSNEQGTNRIVKTSTDGRGNLTFVNNSEDIDNVLLVEHDVREQEINHFNGLQTVEVNQLFISNKQNLFEAYMKNDFDYEYVTPWNTSYSSLHRGVFNCGVSVAGSNTQLTFDLIHPKIGGGISEETPIMKAGQIYNISCDITINDDTSNHRYDITFYTKSGSQIYAQKVDNISPVLSINTTADNTNTTVKINTNTFFNEDVHGIRLHAFYGGEWKFDCTITDFTICEPENAKPDVPLVYEYIDLPQPVQLNRIHKENMPYSDWSNVLGHHVNLADGIAYDSYNPITGEYIQRVYKMTLNGDDGIKYIDNWSGTQYAIDDSTLPYPRKAPYKDTVGRYAGLIDVDGVPYSASYNVQNDIFVTWINRNGIVLNLPRKYTNNVFNQNACKQWLRENPITLYYELETPIVTQLTPITIPTFEGGILQLITTDGKVFPMIEYSMPTNNRYDTTSWEAGAIYTQRNMTEAYFNESTTPMIPTETMTLTTDHISSGSIILNDNGNGLIVLKGNYTGRDIPYFTGMRSVEAIEVETTPSPDQPLFGKGGRK